MSSGIMRLMTIKLCFFALPPQSKVIRGFVVFHTAESARQALSRSLEWLGPRSIEVTIATTKGTLQAEGTHTPAMFVEVSQRWMLRK